MEYSEDVELTTEELSSERQRTGRWVYYKTWEMKPEALEGKEAGGKGVDMVIVHGQYYFHTNSTAAERYPSMSTDIQA